MIIHGGYAKRLREGDHIAYNDIDLFCTEQTLEQFCALLTGPEYIMHRKVGLLPSRVVVVLLPRSRSGMVVKFDIEIVGEDLHSAIWNLPDTQKIQFYGMNTGVASEVSDMLIKEVCDFGNPKHLKDAESYRQSLGKIKLTEHQTFKQLWTTHITSKYAKLAKLGLYDPVAKKLQLGDVTA